MFDELDLGVCVMSVRLISGDEARQLSLADKWELLGPYLKRFGSGCLAYSTLQPGLEYLLLEGRGYVAFKCVGWLARTTFVLGDPICARGDLDVVLNKVCTHLPRPVFVQIRKDVGRRLVRHGFYVNSLGFEVELAVQEWKLRGGDKQNLRTAIHRAETQGIRIYEIGETGVTEQQLAAFSEHWFRSRAVEGTELCFWTRPALIGEDASVRKFVALQGEQLLGFVFCDPLFENGKIVGYGAEVMRVSPEAPRGLIYAMNSYAVARFRQEQSQRFSLGSCIFCKLEDYGEVNSLFTTLFFTALFQYGDRFYNFKGQVIHKREYRGQEVPIYWATRSRWPVGQVIRLFKACGVSPFEQIMQGLRKSLGLRP